MSIAKKLRQVVAANFIEIVRPEEPKAARPEEVKAEAPAPAPANPFTANPQPLTTPGLGQTVEPVEVAIAATEELPVLEIPETLEAPQAATPDEPEEAAPVVTEELPIVEVPIVLEAEAAPVTVVAEESVPSPDPMAAIFAEDSTLTERLEHYEGDFDPMTLLNSGGAVDFDRLLREAGLPPVRFSAEQASKIVGALPDDLPMKVKRMTVKATLEAIDPAASIAPGDVVADAILKKMHITQFRETLAEQIVKQRDGMEAEIAKLNAEIARRQEAIASLEVAKRRATDECDKRIGQMEQVVLFFQSEASGEPLRATASTMTDSTTTDDDELPPFMRDDAVYRLLGLEGKESETDTSPERGRRPRRKIGVNGASEDGVTEI